MNAGLPGIGLSGVFYILSALFMPFAEVVRAATGRARRRSWGTVLGHWTIAMAMITAMWLAGHVLILVLRAAGHHVEDGNLWASAVFALVPFMIVFAAVEVLTVGRRRGRERRRATG